MKKQNKGITLVALIITIVILVILAVVIIREISGEGIIAKAKDASNKYKMAQDEEQARLDEYLNLFESGINLAKAYKQGQTVSLKEKTNYPQIGDFVQINMAEPVEGLGNVGLTSKKYDNAKITKLSTNGSKINIPIEESGTDNIQTYYKNEMPTQTYIILDINEQTGELMLVEGSGISSVGAIYNRIEHTVENITTSFEYTNNIRIQKLASSTNSGLSISGKLSSGYQINRAGSNTQCRVSLKGATGFLNATNVIDKICNVRLTNKYITKARSLKIEDIEKYLGQPTINTNTIDTAKQYYYPSAEGIENVKQDSNIPYTQTYKEYNIEKDNFMQNMEDGNMLRNMLSKWVWTHESGNTISYNPTYILGNTSVKYEDDGTIGYYIASVENGKITGKKLFSSEGISIEIAQADVYTVAYLNANTRGRKAENQLHGTNCWLVGGQTTDTNGGSSGGGSSIGGLNQASMNVQDGIRVIDRIIQNCNTMKSKIEQTIEKGITQEDINEINEIADNAIYNSIQLADGSRTEIKLQTGANAGDTYTINLPNLTAEGLRITKSSLKQDLRARVEDIQNKITELSNNRADLIQLYKDLVQEAQENTLPENLAITTKIIRVSNAIKMQVEEMMQTGVTQRGIDEINRIANQTKYNEVKLTNGSLEQTRLNYDEGTEYETLYLPNLTTQGLGITVDSTHEELIVVAQNIQSKIDEINEIKARFAKYYEEHPEYYQTGENTQSAESRIRDTDMASE